MYILIIYNLYEEPKTDVFLSKVLDKVSRTVNWTIIDKNPKNPFKTTVKVKISFKFSFLY